MSNLSIPIDRVAISSSVSFRHDINVLRGLAILAVVLYHFAPALLPGGFVGVDIFFVISGFLMTSIIMNGIEKEKFCLLSFYAARFRRIAPALMVMSATLMVAFWSWLPSIEYKKLGSYVGYVILFISNIKLNKESSDYFASDSHENWFLHTWSLSVEWQFYLLLPLLIVLLSTLKKTRLIIHTYVLLGFISFLCCLYFHSESTSSTFYLFQYRSWEMLSGGLVALLKPFSDNNSKLRRIVALTGYVILAASIIILKPSIAWPGLYTIFPVVGTMLCLASNSKSVAVMLDKYIGWIGLSSYSVYLWHWPVAVFLTYASLNKDTKWIIIGICVSFLIGVISWITIERTLKKHLEKVSNRSLCYIALIAIGILYLSSYLIKHQFIISSAGNQIDMIALEANNKNYAENPKTHFSFYGTGSPKAIILGDSHAVATATALASAVGDRGSVIGLTFSGCPNIAFGELKGHSGCSIFNREVTKRLSQYDANVPVFIVNRTMHYIENRAIEFENSSGMVKDENNLFKKSLTDMVCNISKSHKVFIVNPIPEMPVNVPRFISHSLMMGYSVEDVTSTVQSYNTRNKVAIEAQQYAATQCGAEILKPVDFLCHGGVCYGSKNLQPFYFDNNHLSQTGNKWLIPMFKNALER